MTMQPIEPHSPLADDIRLLFHVMQGQQAEWQQEKGWADEGDRLRADVHAAQGHLEEMDPRRLAAEANLRNYYIAKLALIDTEVAEAIEEIRNGHAIDETYFPKHADDCRLGAFSTNPADFGVSDCTCTPKPEGVLSEIADVVIRIWSLCGEADLPLAEVIIQKLNYNATRALRHGGKAI